MRLRKDFQIRKKFYDQTTGLGYVCGFIFMLISMDTNILIYVDWKINKLSNSYKKKRFSINIICFKQNFRLRSFIKNVRLCLRNNNNNNKKNSLILSDTPMNNRFATPPSAKMQILVHSRRTGSALYFKFHYLTTLAYDMLQTR